MGYSILPILVFDFLSMAVGYQDLTSDGVHFINRLNDIHHFDHHIFLVEPTTDGNPWVENSFIQPGKNYTPQTVYTVEDYSETNFTEHIRALQSISGKNTLLIAVVGSLKIENGSQLLAQVEHFRKLTINVKIGVFFHEKINSLHIIEKLFRWSWSAGIVNIFSGFHFQSSVDDEPATFNVFKYNPFGQFDLINVTRSESLRDIFFDNSQFPNYRKLSIPLARIRELNVSYSDRTFWDTVIDVFNASASEINITYGETVRERILIHEKGLTDSIIDVTYPHQQTKVVTIVPHAKPYSDFLAYFQSGTWTQLYVYTFVVVTSTSLVLIISRYLHQRKISPLQCVADVVNLLVNDNTQIKYSKLFRADVFVTVPLTFTGLIVMNGIVSIFRSYITAPIYQPQINTFKDLYTSSVPIETNEIAWKKAMVEYLEDVTKYGGWNNRIRGVKLYEVVEKIESFNISIAFFVTDQQAEVHLEAQKRLNLKERHMLSGQFLNRYLLSYKLSSNFPFIESLNDIIHRLNGAGLIDKWKQQSNERVVRYHLEKKS